MPKFSFLVVGSLALLAAAVAAGPAVAAGGDDPPKSVEIEKSKALIDNKDFKPVVLLFKAALAKAPNNADAWNLMGYAHRKLGQVDQALGFYQKALSLNAEHRGALEYLGELYLQTGRPKQAKEMLKRLDDAYFSGCEEYDDLKKALQVAKVID
ncbi:MAG: tetratricopeptide repeat protein [Pseudomonadota bacterium]|nr:tetratricopeptide repeat protein [Pseudomonadota bacterium]